MHRFDLGNATFRAIQLTDRLSIRAGRLSIESTESDEISPSPAKVRLVAMVRAEYHAPAERAPFKLTVENVLDRLREDLASRRR